MSDGIIQSTLDYRDRLGLCQLVSPWMGKKTSWIGPKTIWNADHWSIPTGMWCTWSSPASHEAPQQKGRMRPCNIPPFPCGRTVSGRFCVGGADDAISQGSSCPSAPRYQRRIPRCGRAARRPLPCCSPREGGKAQRFPGSARQSVSSMLSFLHPFFQWYHVSCWQVESEWISLHRSRSCRQAISW